MGQRANLLIVENAQYQLYYSHWCANTLTRDLFWGPEYAVEFIRIQRKVDESDWLDEVWAEGAAVVELDRKSLLLYGGEDILWDVPLRRIYLDLLRRVWKGWEVQWAYEGIATIAEYVGFPRSKVLVDRDRSHRSTLKQPDQKDWTDLVASIRSEPDGIRLYPLAGDLVDYLFCGPTLLNAPEAGDGIDQLPLAEWVTSFPTGGFHIDVPSKTLEFWLAKEAPDVLARVSECWPSWKVIWHKDVFEFQVDRTDGCVCFPTYSRETLVRRVSEMLLVEVHGGGVDTIRMVTEMSLGQGKTVDINPWALRDDRLDLSQDVRRRILATAISQKGAG